jgi:hypothetical protein
LPTTDGTNGQAIVTNGSGTLSFTTVSGLPSQTGNTDKYLKTDGSTASWSTLPTKLQILTRSATTTDVSLANGYVPVTNRAGSTIQVTLY